MDGCNYFREIKKHCNLKKKLLPRQNTVTCKKKKFFLETTTLDHSPFLCYISKIFVHLSVIAAPYYFRAYKLIVWAPTNIYLFKFNNRNTRKMYEICPKLTIITIKSRSGVFSISFEMFLLLTLNR